MTKNDNIDEDEVVEKKEELPEVEQELSKVAVNPKQSLMILVGISLIFLYLFYNFFLKSDDVKKNDDTISVPSEIARPAEVADSSDNIPSIPTLPSPPKLEDPSLPPPPPPSSDKNVADVVSLPETKVADEEKPNDNLLPPGNSIAPTLPIATTTSNEDKKNRIEKKRKSPIFLLAGAPKGKDPQILQQEADFQDRGNMNLVLSRGKLIDAVVESAINSDFGGEVRGVITRDVYSEWGKNILIPKGSKIFGTYVSGVEGQMARIAITWVRVDLINGYVINFSGIGTDNLSRKGIPGRLDNKFKERFTNAVMRSAFNITLANALDSIVTPQINSQAAATQTAQATSIRNIANNATATTEQDAVNQITSVCANVQNAIIDKSSTAFSSVQTACTIALNSSSGATAVARLNTLRNAINSAADSLIQVTNQSVTPTKAQEAAKTAFTDITDEVKKLLEEQDLKPTVTIQQGTKFKIYVNRDFKFPTAAVGRVRVVK